LIAHIFSMFAPFVFVVGEGGRGALAQTVAENAVACTIQPEIGLQQWNKIRLTRNSYISKVATFQLVSNTCYCIPYISAYFYTFQHMSVVFFCCGDQGSFLGPGPVLGPVGRALGLVQPMAIAMAIAMAPCSDTVSLFPFRHRLAFPAVRRLLRCWLAIWKSMRLP